MRRREHDCFILVLFHLFVVLVLLKTHNIQATTDSPSSSGGGSVCHQGIRCAEEPDRLFTPENNADRQERRHSPPEMAAKMFACDFEVFGIVQGVFFRKYTQKQATSLGLKGWCMNTRDGTVKGQMEGEVKPINEMKHWLQTKGSPSSRIDKAVFGEMKEIPKYSFNDFSVKR